MNLYLCSTMHVLRIRLKWSCLNRHLAYLARGSLRHHTGMAYIAAAISTAESFCFIYLLIILYLVVAGVEVYIQVE